MIPKEYINLLKIIKAFVSELKFVLIYYSPLHFCLYSSTDEYSHCQRNNNKRITPLSLKRNVGLKNSSIVIV